MSRALAAKKQDEKIDVEIKRLSELFEGLSESKRKIATKLIERVAFMTITLELLEDDIKKRGPTIKFKNGKQEMIVENPSQKSYNTMINRYTTAYEKLINLIPQKPTDGEEEDDFDDFVDGRGD